MRTKSILGALLSVLVAATGIAAPSTAAQASPASGLVPSVALKSLMQHYPGSVQVAEGIIRIAPGVIVGISPGVPRDKPVPAYAAPAAAASPSAARSAGAQPARPVKPAGPTGHKAAEPELLTAESTIYGCVYEYLCLYSEPNWHPSSVFLGLYFCRFEDLSNYKFGSSGVWNDKMSSYVNNQTPGTYSTFHNWNGTNAWVFQFDSTAIASRPSLGSYDNKIDGVRVC